MNDTPSPQMRRAAHFAFFALLLLLMLPNLIWLYFSYNDIAVWVNALVVPSLLLAIVFAVLGERLWLACLLLAPFALLAPGEAGYIARYQHPTNPEILATLFATNPREIREYLGDVLLPLFFCTAIGLVVPLSAAWCALRARLRWRHDSRKLVLVLVVVIPLAVGAVSAVDGDGGPSMRLRDGISGIVSLADPIQYGYPFGLFHRYAEYRREWAEMRADVARLAAFRFHAQRVTHPHGRQIYVLVIGESSRRDRWQLFGYSRATNPELTRIRNIVPIPDMLSSWPESIAAIPMVVTRKPPTDASIGWNEGSIVRAMDEAGYDTWWISNQMPIGRFDSPVSTFAYEARHADFRNHTSWYAPGTYDEDLLPPLREAVRDSGKDLFIVLHLMGSHHGYDFRYPESFRRFRPADSDVAPEVPTWVRDSNSYDNSILYTDHVLAQVIGILQDSGAITALWYESDHGEALPNAKCKLAGHGNGTRFEYEISALFWSSDSFATVFPDRLPALRANAGKRVMSANTFESLVDMAGVTYPGRDPSQSLFDAQWRYRPRMVNYPWKVDMDNARFSNNCQLALPRNQ